ncbi:cysteine-rich and transmembrane domain-containing protein 1-like [Centropristis striata]|uniref:cysteine-rich and transmembrane domain-containing protein 1-like n=1 Tax=Centropristis striata TaxID=184440 RepID=UPI0027DFF282|nr:cysteine-rich and transmembrane domain-containing protein 1-like [Centropristis striata]
MNSDNPPPYVPHPPGGPSAPGGPAAFSSQPAAFPGAPYQTFPQTYTGGGDYGYYHGASGPPGPPGPPGHFLTQPGYQGYHSGPPGASCPWDGPKTHREHTKPTVFLVERGHDHEDDGGFIQSCLSACSAALCCCCLLDMFTHKFS